MGNSNLALNGGDRYGVLGVGGKDLSWGVIWELEAFLARDTLQLCSHLLRQVEPADVSSALTVCGVPREPSQLADEPCLGDMQEDVVSHCVPLPSHLHTPAHGGADSVRELSLAIDVCGSAIEVPSEANPKLAINMSKKGFLILLVFCHVAFYDFFADPSYILFFCRVHDDTHTHGCYLAANSRVVWIRDRQNGIRPHTDQSTKLLPLAVPV